jgi:hypothetical protein
MNMKNSFEKCEQNAKDEFNISMTMCVLGFVPLVYYLLRLSEDMFLEWKKKGFKVRKNKKKVYPMRADKDKNVQAPVLGAQGRHAFESKRTMSSGVLSQSLPIEETKVEVIEINSEV